MKKFSVLLAAAMLLSLFTACAGNGGAANDKFVFAQGADPRGLDPALVDDGESAMVIVNVYEGLTQYGSDSTEVLPCLATKWDVSADSLEYTFTLREGVKFHDGTAFNAEAVKTNIDRQLPPNDTTDMPYAEFTFGYVSSVEVVSEYVVKITLSQPCTPFLANLAMSQAAPMVSPAQLAKAEGAMENPVGTGPFKFVKWDKGVAVTLVRNDSYWGDKPKLKDLIIQITPDNSTRASQMMAGEIDAMNGLDASNVEAVKNKGAKIFQADGMNINYMAFNMTRAPFDDARVREAIVRAINVPELVEALYQGYSATAYSVLPSFMPGYNANAKPFEYDPEKAKQLLTDAGISDLSITMVTYSNPRPYNAATGTKLAEAIMGYLTAIGVTVDITQYDWTTYKEKVVQGEGDIRFYGWIGDNGDPDNFMNLLSDSDPAMNVSGYNNTQYNDLIKQAAATPNGEERNALYGQMEEIVAAEAPWLPISHAQSMAAYGANVKNFSVHPTGNIFFSRISKE